MALNKLLKNGIASLYKECSIKDDATKAPTRRCEEAPLSGVATWIKEVRVDLPTDFLTGFRKSCISNALDGTSDDILWGNEDIDGATYDDDQLRSTNDEATCSVE